jgi:hypothetical protein
MALLGLDWSLLAAICSFPLTSPAAGVGGKACVGVLELADHYYRPMLF